MSESCVVYDGASLLMGSLIVYVVGVITIPLIVKLKTIITEIRAGVKISKILKRKVIE
tara:strand:- start:219 stop:392 length:174 start_codon:yes stop_codon:yes gene_type:complete